MTTKNRTVVVTIGGVDHTAGVRAESLVVHNTMGQVCSCEFVMDANVHAVAVSDRVEVLVNSNAVFGGYIVEAASVLHDTGTVVDLSWKVQCQDYSILLDRTLVDESYISQHPDTTLAAIMAGVIANDGFTLESHISAGATSKPFVFDKVTLRTAIEMIVTSYQAYWYVTPAKVVVIYPVDSYAISGYGVDSEGDNSQNAAIPLAGSLTVERTTTGLINSVTVYGAKVVSEVERTFVYNGNGSLTIPITPEHNHEDGDEPVGLPAHTHNHAIILPIALSQGEFTLNPIPSIVERVEIVAQLLAGGTVTFSQSQIEYFPAHPGGAYYIKLLLNGVQKARLWVQVDLTNGMVTADWDAQGPPPDTFSNALYSMTVVCRGYSYGDQITYTATDTASINAFGLYEYEAPEDLTITTYELAQLTAEYLLEKYSGARQTVKVTTTEAFPQVGHVLGVNAPSVGLNNETLQAVSLNITARIVPTVGYVAFGELTLGTMQDTAVDILATLINRYNNNEFGVGKPQNRLGGYIVIHRVSDIAASLGNITSGRAVFTDGGNGRLSWEDYNGHTGALIGLEEIAGNPQRGAVYILDAGTVKAKLGYMDGLGSVGTVAPSGWGIWTQNGYFSGVVAASQVIGGTVTGVQITGNTITGGTITGGYISGGTIAGGYVDSGTVVGSYITGATIAGNSITGGSIAGNIITGGSISGAYVSGGTVSGGVITGGSISGAHITGGTIAGNLITGGTIRTSGSVVNSSNPGVTMDATGLFGYGTAGLSFKLPSDPADRPVFSSGTILNTVYEITTASILRTGTINPKVQIDNSGIFAYNPGGTLTFSVDATTGQLTASDGVFSGAVVATSGTVTGSFQIGTAGTIVSGNTILNSAGISVGMGTVYNTNDGYRFTSGGTVFSGMWSRKYSAGADVFISANYNPQTSSQIAAISSETTLRSQSGDTYNNARISLVCVNGASGDLSSFVLDSGASGQPQYLAITTGTVAVTAAKSTFSGNVGIGTPTPNAPLHVVGNGYFSGSVGIGITTPGAKLDTRTANSTDFALQIVNGSSFPNIVTVNDGGLGLWAPTGTSPAQKGYFLRSENNGANLSLYASSTANLGGTSAIVSLGTAAITILAGGNVGIGTVTPTSKLQVVGIPEHADNAAAISAGLTNGAFYRQTGTDYLNIVH